MKTFIKIQCLILLFAIPLSAQITDKYYLQREKLMPIAMKQKILMLRTKMVAKKWKFTVGYTTAMDRNIQQLAGLRAPINLSQMIKLQKNFTIKLNKKDIGISIGESPKIKIKRSSGLRKWDWRKVKKVSPVRNQLSCGSCWAFATLGAFEANYRIRNIKHIDVSEQCVLNCSGKGSCKGGWWAFDFLINKGVAAESSYSYTANDKPCSNNIAKPYKAVSWGYVDGMTPSVAKIKAALCKYGPLAVAVYVSPSFQAYTGGVFNDNENKSVNHGVTLIGWDDNKQAWIIKNSWGKGWGSTAGYGTEKGYMYIGYGCSKIGYAAAWVKAKKTPKPKTEDCIAFNPNKISVRLINKRWKIVEGRNWLKDFSSRTEALKALRIIKHYRMNKMCFVGRPNPSLEYYLVNNQAPRGSFVGEDSIAFRLKNLKVKYIRNDWKIVDGQSWLLSFGKKRAEAYEALKIIKKYSFTRICYVGRPGPSMTYFRR